MRTRITAYVLLMVLVLAAVAVAQGSRPRVEKRVGLSGATAPVQQLGLSQEQRQQISDVVKKYRADVKAAVQSDASREQKAEQIKGLREKAAAAIDAILTPEQREKARQMGLTQRLLRLDRCRRAKALWTLKQLNLTEEQKASVKTIMQDARTRAKATKDDSTLTPEAKRAKFLEIKKEAFDKTKALLTPEQLKKLEEMKNRRPRARVRGAL